MPEAIGLILRFGFRELRLNRIFARIFAGNLASQKVLLKSGFTFEGTLKKGFKKNNRYIDELIFGILKSEFK
jgi:ribosomal-protein-alanine N-acetyltransferase